MSDIDMSMYIRSRCSVRLIAKKLNSSDSVTTKSEQEDTTVEPTLAPHSSSGTSTKRRHYFDEDEIVVASGRRSKVRVQEDGRKTPTSNDAFPKIGVTRNNASATCREQGLTNVRELMKSQLRAAVPVPYSELANSISQPGSTTDRPQKRSLMMTTASEIQELRQRTGSRTYTSSKSHLETATRKAGPRSRPAQKPRSAPASRTSSSTRKRHTARSNVSPRGMTEERQFDSVEEYIATPEEPSHEAHPLPNTPIRPPFFRAHHPYGLLTPPGSQASVRTQTRPIISSELLALSKKLTYREPLASKSEPRGQPLVWADSRQALCETVPYFKMPQSGCHQNDGHVYAFLFDSAAGCREYMDPDVIVARAGGGMEADGTGRMLHRKSHNMSDAQVKAVQNDILHQNPLVIICGNRNESAQCRMPHKYCVLDWYKPIAVWAEKTMGKGGLIWTTIKYRFERLGRTRPAWHAPEMDSITDEDRDKAGKVISATCRYCRKDYKQIYLVAWMCLNPDCPEFWKIDLAGQDAGYGDLDYHPAFLLDRTEWQAEMEPYSVKPSIPDVGNIIGDNLTRINTRGICCPFCGRCSPRRLFRGWKCDNESCDFEFMPHHTPVKPPMLHNPWDITGNGPSLAQNKHASGVSVTVEHVEGYKILRYTISGIEGCILHAVSNGAINLRPKGPDDLFEAMQRQESADCDLRLERRRFAVQRAADCKPEDGDLMMAFSMNYGMPYKFVASGASLPFEDSPWPVRASRSTLNRASQILLDPSKHHDFNELLIFAYMEGQKIEYHDDGERGLGPRIATLSLGAKAKMYLRMKRKHYVGCSLQGVFTSDRPRPGGIDGADMDDRRLAAWQELQQIKNEDPAMYERRRRELPAELGLSEKRNKWAPDLVTLTLHHGDIVLMEGYEIQQYLEHKVVPEGCLRFALTCRTVLEDHLLPDERPDYEVAPDDGTASFL